MQRELNFSQQDMADVMEETFERLRKLRAAGQAEYAHGPAFGNFNRLEDLTNVDRRGVLWIYLQKHLDGITAFIGGHESQREDVIGRIDDARVYLSLLEGMILEDRTNAKLQGSK